MVLYLTGRLCFGRSVLVALVMGDLVENVTEFSLLVEADL